MELTERFADLCGRDAVRLDEICAVIGAHGDESCDVDSTLRELDGLASSVSGPRLEDLLATIFVRKGFTGDRVTYHDPRNSYLHSVLHRRRGIPITLSIVVMEVGRRVEIEVEGIGTPANFMARAPDGRYIDSFDGGRVLDRAGLEASFTQIVPGLDIAPYLGALPGLEIVRRVLGNLVSVQRQLGDRDGLLWTTQLRTLVPGSSPDDRRTFGGALAACGDFIRAAKVLESLVDEGQATDPDRELAEAQRLRARLN